MAKKKDTLKDLNKFMQSRSPEKEEGKEDYLSKKPTTLAEIEALKSEIKRLDELPEGALNEIEIANFIIKVAKSNQLPSRQILYRVCAKVLSQIAEKEGSDIILENFILYLEHQDLLLSKIKS
jgi:hypothetical protein